MRSSTALVPCAAVALGCLVSAQSQPSQDSGSSPGADDGSGVDSLEFNARIRSGIDCALVASAENFGQHGSRDPASASTTDLTNALRGRIAP